MLYPINRTSSAIPAVRKPLTGRRIMLPEDGVAGPPPRGDTADVTKTVDLLAAIDGAADAVPSVDQARIAQLQQAIAAGTFEAHSQQILQSVVALETQLYG